MCGKKRGLLHKKMAPILLVEKDQERANSVTALFSAGDLFPGIQITTASTLAQALNLFPEKEQKFNAILVDLSLSDSQGLTTFTRLHQKAPHIPIIVIVSAEDVALGEQTLRQGAYDYFVKGDTPEGDSPKGEVGPKELSRMLRHTLEKKELLDRLNENEGEQFRDMIEKSNQGQVVVNLKGIVHYVNPAAEKILGKPRDQLVEKAFEYPISHNKTTDLKIASANGETKIVETQVTEIKWGALPAYLVAMYDITNLEIIEHLKAEIIQRQKVDRLKDEFVSAVSHELRTPLTIIKGAIDNLRDGVAGALDPKQTKVIDIAYTNSNRLIKIINNLLDLSRLESGHSHFQRANIKIYPLIQEAVRNFQVSMRDKELILNAQIPVDLPEIYADSDMVVQVINNLLDNAIRYANKQIGLTVRPIEEKNKKNLEIVVSDDGPGIPIEKRENLFSKFVQINRPTGGAGYKGTGLGLAICREITNLHHGKIWIDSNFNGGCHFHVTFPIFHVLSNTSLESP